MIACKKNNIYIGVLFIVLFLALRGYYFIAPDNDLHVMSSDSMWWWGYQNQIIQGDYFDSNPYYSARHHYRLKSDIFIQNKIVDISNSIGVDRFTLNLAITSSLFFLAMLFIALTSYTITGSATASLFALFLITQTKYFELLRYVVFTPKMLAFVLMPLLFFSVSRLYNGMKPLITSCLIFLFGVILYPVSFLYTFFPIAISSGLFLYFIYRKNVKTHIYPLVIYFGFCCVLLSIVNYLNASDIPPSLAVTKIGYSTYIFSFGKFIRYIHSNLPLLIISILLFYYCQKKPGWRQYLLPKSAMFYLILGTLLLCQAVLAHLLAFRVDKIRMLWIWRTEYYVSLALIISAVCSLTWLLDQQYLKKYMVSLIVVLLSLTVLTLGRHGHPHLRDTTISWLATLNKERIVSKDTEDVISVINALPVPTTVLYPPLEHQNKESDLIQALIKHTVLFARAERGLLIVQKPLTSKYAKTLSRLKALPKQFPDEQYLEQILILSREFGATHVLVNKTRLNGLQQSALSQQILYENSHWMILKSCL